MTPHIREEVDYVVKRWKGSKRRFSIMFKRMVACKIMYVRTLLFGSEQIFHRVKSMLRDRGVTANAGHGKRLFSSRRLSTRLLDEGPEKSTK